MVWLDLPFCHSLALSKHIPRMRAIDIVLLPPDDVMSLVVELNGAGVKTNQATIPLDLKNRIPHLSLLMGVLDDEQYARVQESLHIIAKQYGPVKALFDTAKDTAFFTPNTGDVQALHRAILKTVDPLLTHSVTQDMFLEPAGTAFPPDFDHWVNTFVTEHSVDAFQPHITVHTQSPIEQALPFSCTFTRLAVCHLGVYNTCREIIAEYRLE